MVEPKYPGVVESYVNLGDCYDKEGLGDVRTEIMACMKGYKDCYRRAYRCLGASAEISEDLRAILLTQSLEERMQKRAKGIIKREFKRTGGGAGAVRQRFLGAMTPDGSICKFSTANAIANRVYELADNYGLAHPLLSHLLTGATAAGYDVIACPSPMAPDRLEHLIIPELRLAFVTASAAVPYEGHPDRRLRLDAMADRELLRRNRPRLRFAKKVAAALVEEAAESLAEAKRMHDDLEALYNPYVNFNAVDEVAGRIADEILSLPA
ncbi:MAG: hypothetical protein HFF09_05760 [Oscillospiraceae bacterium]|nr:hypothetical protein [Oscillospiraceae bacterium]